MNTTEMSVFSRPAANSREYLIGKWMLVTAIILAIAMIGFFAVGFGRLGAVCFWGIVALGVAYELMRGVRFFLRVLTNWLPGLSIITARYESCLDAKANV